MAIKRLNVASEDTLQDVKTDVAGVKEDVASVNSNIGDTADIGGSSSEGTSMAKLNYLIESLKNVLNSTVGTDGLKTLDKIIEEKVNSAKNDILKVPTTLVKFSNSRLSTSTNLLNITGQGELLYFYSRFANTSSAVNRHISIIVDGNRLTPSDTTNSGGWGAVGGGKYNMLPLEAVIDDNDLTQYYSLKVSDIEYTHGGMPLKFNKSLKIDFYTINDDYDYSLKTYNYIVSYKPN